ncbi:uncharacterized protein LOC144118664 isoform X2 [Amblyomma americanum]
MQRRRCWPTVLDHAGSRSSKEAAEFQGIFSYLLIGLVQQRVRKCQDYTERCAEKVADAFSASTVLQTGCSVSKLLYREDSRMHLYSLS